MEAPVNKVLVCGVHATTAMSLPQVNRAIKKAQQEFNCLQLASRAPNTHSPRHFYPCDYHDTTCFSVAAPCAYVTTSNEPLASIREDRSDERHDKAAQKYQKQRIKVRVSSVGIGIGTLSGVLFMLRRSGMGWKKGPT